MILLAGAGCRGDDGTRPPAPFEVSVQQAELVLDDVGDTARVAVSVTGGDPGTDPGVAWTSRDTLVARVTQDGNVVGAGQGSTWVLVTVRGDRDSVAVNVGSTVGSIEISPEDTTLPLGRSARFFALAFDPMGVPRKGLLERITWHAQPGVRIDSTQILRTGDTIVDVALWVTGTAVGDALVEARAGDVVGTARLRVTPMPALAATPDTIFTAVDARPAVRPIIVSPGYRVFESGELTLRIEDPTIARLAATTFPLSALQTSNAWADPIGLRPGITRLIASAPGYEPVSVPVVVSPLRLRLDPERLDLVGGRLAFVSVNARDSTGRLMRNERPLDFVLSSSDPTVALLSLPGPRTVPAGEVGTGSQVTTGNPGQSAWIVLEQPGYAPDSTRVDVHAGRVWFDQGFVSPGGRREFRHAAGTRFKVFYHADVYPAGPTVMNFSHSNPDIVGEWPASIPVPANTLQQWIPINAAALLPGVDTIVVSGPGLRGDTIVVVQDSALFGFDDFLTPPFLPLERIASGTTYHGTVNMRNRHVTLPLVLESDIPVTVTSSDPTVLRPKQATVLVTPDPHSIVRNIELEALKPGRATLTFSSTRPYAGTYTSKEIEVTPNPIVLQQEGVVTLGMRQHLRLQDRIPVGVPGARFQNKTVTFRSTDPAVARPTEDERVITDDAHLLDILAGEREGTAWIVATGAGLESDSVEVRVGRPRVGIAAERVGMDSDTTVRWEIRVEARDHAGRLRLNAEAVRFRITTSDPAIATADSATLELAADEGISSRRTLLRFRRDSSVIVHATDTRTVPQAYGEGVVELSRHSVLSISGTVLIGEAAGAGSRTSPGAGRGTGPARRP